MSTLPQKFNTAELINLPAEPEAPEAPNLFAELGTTLRKRKLLIALSIFAGVLVAGVMLLFSPSLYMAGTTLEVQGLNENFMNMISVDPQAGTGAYSTNTLNIETQIRILESGSLRGPVIDRLLRETTPSLPPQSGLLAQARKLLHIGNDDPLESTRGAIFTANGTMNAKSILGTRIIVITCESTNPDVAAAYVNALAADYISQNSEIHAVNAQKTGQWLAGQLEETQAKLEQAETKLAEFVQKAGITVIGDQETLADSKMHVLQGDLAALKAETISKKALLDKVTNAPPEVLPDIIQDPELKAYQTRIADLKVQKALLMTKLTPEHSKVKDLDMQISILQAAFGKTRENVVARYRSDYEEAIKRDQMMSSAYTGEASTIASQSDKMAQYGMLKREADILRLSLNAILQETNQASIASALPTDSVRVVDSASPPNAISHPVATQVLAQGAAGGLVFGGVLGFLIERRKRKTLSRKFADPGRSTLVLNIRELGVIPSMEGEQRPNRLLGMRLPKRSVRLRLKAATC